MKPWYKELFINYARTYDKEPFTQGTIGEVDFIEKELNFDKSKIILDIGCGTGRHAIELAKRGYKVTGIDLSESQLQRAREKAKENSVEVRFVCKDARNLNFKNEFDLVMMICEGAFPLMETDEMNFKILENASKALKTNGKLILTTLSALYPLYHSVKDFINTGVGDGISSANSFDLKTFRDTSTFEATDDDGKKKTLSCNERYYTPSEISWYLKSLNFKTIDIYGCEGGAFSRSKPLTTNDFEMLVIAVK
ncbi:MAG: class I SAM-dependent methyltransferase [Ignavibacteriales bacterium]|nr:class I SAM-dependent methyltransferase [Ignavibacteriales bacterium]